jgi:regulator of protease activity HflC (stomatin/prohibitin superfamily)
VESIGFVVALAGVVAALAVVRLHWPQFRTVREHERALRYRKGYLLGELGPGRYWLRPRIDEITVVDARRRQVVVPGQEVLTRDRVPLKVSMIAEFTVVSATKALTVVERFEDVLYGRIQLALREAVAQRDLDTALEERGELGSAIRDAVAAPALEFGLEVHQVQVRDFMMAGGLRNSYTEVVEAKQRGLAALERARGESAAARSLANAAQLMEKHPGLMHLRLLQAVETGSGNRIVIALDPERGRSSDVEIVAEGEA